MARRHIHSLFAALLALAVLGAPARAADLIPVNVLVIPADSSAEVFYAQDMGFFKAAGLDVHIGTMGSSPPIIAALVSGSADIGNAVVGSAVAARSRGIPVQFFAPAGLYLASSPTAKLVALADSPLKSASDVNGKTVAVTGLADLTYWAVKAWMDQAGGNWSTVKFIELPVPEMVPALAAHRIDAAVMLEPFIAANSDTLRTVAPVDDFVAKRFLATGWAASEAWLKAHPDVADRYAAAMKQTAAWANTHRKESAAILLKYTKLTPETAAKMERATYGTVLDAALMQPVIDNAQKYGGFPRPVTLSELIWSPAK